MTTCVAMAPFVSRRIRLDCFYKVEFAYGSAFAEISTMVEIFDSYNRIIAPRVAKFKYV